MAATGVLQKKLGYIALGCGGLAFGIFATRKKTSPYLGMGAVSLPPFLAVSNGDLVTTQQTFINPGGIKVLLIPTLPVADKTFYHDIIHEMQTANAVVLQEGVSSPPVIGGSASLPPSASTSDEKFDNVDLDDRRQTTETTFRDYPQSLPEKQSSKRFSGWRSGEATENAPLKPQQLGSTMAQQSYFDDLLRNTFVDKRVVMADVSAEACQWRFQTIFQFEPLAQQRYDFLILALETQERKMQQSDYFEDRVDMQKRGGKGEQVVGPPEAIAIPWNVGSCPQIAKALKDRGYTQTHSMKRVVLGSRSYKMVFGWQFRPNAGIASLASKLVRG